MDEKSVAWRRSQQELWPRSGLHHKDDLNRWIAENTTPDQRIAWLFRMRDLLADQILADREREAYDLGTNPPNH